MKSKKEVSKQSGDEETVIAYMNKLEHPLKAEMEALRGIIKSASDKISERIKWNAPSYFSKADLLTFNPRSVKNVHIVFHSQPIVNIESALLHGEYKDRRMMYFENMAEVQAHKQELERILVEYVELVEKANP